jgi:hypothetical protein
LFFLSRIAPTKTVSWKKKKKDFREILASRDAVKREKRTFSLFSPLCLLSLVVTTRVSQKRKTLGLYAEYSNISAHRKLTLARTYNARARALVNVGAFDRIVVVDVVVFVVFVVLVSSP